ncbi:MAG: hypothetical protein PHW02_04375 [bacterium]|nr:hypothetical protein [bacterium]
MKNKTESYKEIKNELGKIRRSRRFYNRFDAPTLANEIGSIENRIMTELIDDDEKIELILKLFDSEEHFINSCDDSDGDLGDVYYGICSSFCLIAKNHKDREEILQLIENLMEKNNYGLHDGLLEKLSEFMTREEMKELYEYFMKLTMATMGDDIKSRLGIHIPTSIAKSLQDAELYEKTVRIIKKGELHDNEMFNIGQIHYKNKNFTKAKEWLLELLEKGYYKKNDVFEILLNIALDENDKKTATEYAKEILMSSMNKKNYDTLIGLIGEEKKDELKREIISAIEKENPISGVRLEFLLDIDALSEIDRIVIAKKESLNGFQYIPLQICAKELEQKNYLLSTSLIYRALINELLGRAIAKYYIYAIRYMKKLDNLAEKIDDWKNMDSHEAYKNEVRVKHSRKSAFWKKYENIIP